MVIIDNTIKKINAEINKISRDLMNVHRAIPGAVNRAMVIEGNSLRNYIIESMRNTPRMLVYVTKGYAKNKKSRSIHHPSAPGFPPAIDTGELVRSILYDVKDMTLRVGSIAGTKVGDGDKSYAWIHELRKSIKDRRPWLKPAVVANEKRIMDNIGLALKREFKKRK
jgi:hypothetical protein